MRIIKFGFICLLNLAALTFFIVNKFDVYPRAYLVWLYLILLSIGWYNTKDKKEKNYTFEAIMTVSFLGIILFFMLNYNMPKTEKSEFHFTAGDDINPEIIKTEVYKYNNAKLIGKWEVLETEKTDDFWLSDSGELKPLSSTMDPSYFGDISIKYISIYCKEESYVMFQFDSENQMSNIYESRSTPDSSYVIFGPFDLFFNTISMDFTHNRYKRIE